MDNRFEQLEKQVQELTELVTRLQYAHSMTPELKTAIIQVVGDDLSLDDLADVTISSPTSTQVLKYNGSVWINDTDDIGAS